MNRSSSSESDEPRTGAFRSRQIQLQDSSVESITNLANSPRVTAMNRSRHLNRGSRVSFSNTHSRHSTDASSESALDQSRRPAGVSRVPNTANSRQIPDLIFTPHGEGP